MSAHTTQGRNRSLTATLLAVVVATVVAAVVLMFGDGLPMAIRLPLVLPLLLFTPGYAVLTAVFPPAEGSADRNNWHNSAGGSDRFSNLERGVVAVVLSTVLVPTVALSTTAVTGLSVTLTLTVVVAITLTATAIALVRLPATDGQKLAAGRADGIRQRVTGALTHLPTVAAVGVVTILLVSSLGIAITGSSGDALRTEFYLANGTTPADSGGPQEPSYDLRVAHQAENSQQYTVVVLRNASGDGTAAELQRQSAVVRSNETATVTVGAGTGTEGTLQFLLYKGEAPAEPESTTAHRHLRLVGNRTVE